jgi:hypothetical protein
VAAPDETAWSLSASGYAYLLPDEPDYVQPTVTADHGRLHLEARYNYEGLETGSAWIGYNWSAGTTVRLDLTPMVGGVFGETAGVAPGYRLGLAWRKLELSTEGEYLFDTGTESDSFFYAWTELAYSPRGWLRLGLVAQRTRVYETELDIQRGVLAGVAYKNLSFTGYVFNPDGKATVVLAVSVTQ